MMRCAAVAAALLLGGCATLPRGFSPGPALTSLAISEVEAARALDAFRQSCPVLLRGPDASGLNADWRGVCAEASTTNDARTFFTQRFRALRVGDGQGFVTGYYEPEIAASRVADAAYATPVYRLPPGYAPGSIDRAAIAGGALAGQGLEIAWAADPIELFFLQIQGSGRLHLPDGSVVRIGYAGQNGFPYTAIGALMQERGLIAPGHLSMQSIIDWLRAHPAEGAALMLENRSYVFFHELTGPGPVGALGVPVTPHATIAADPAFMPLGAPVVLAVDRPEANGLWIAQDTGGAIKGANRFDTFWGTGAEARSIAGGMSARGAAWLLVPRKFKHAPHRP